MATTQRQTLTIANGATSSDAFNAGTCAAFGLQLPAAFTGTAVTFTVSGDGSTFQDLYDATGATKISVAVTQGRSYDLPAELTAWPYFKVVSGSAEGAARSLVVVGKRA